MVNGRRIISAVICGLIVTAAVHADMVPVSHSRMPDLGKHMTVCDRMDLYNKNMSF